jgi:hypothetical protein
MDRIYTQCRRQLHSLRNWGYGPERVHEVAKSAFDAITRFTSLQGKVYCDLGCGHRNPYGVSSVMFLNGAASTIAIDILDYRNKRTAEALMDLLFDIVVNPERWNWCDASGPEFSRRLNRFNMKAIREGQIEKGFANVPMKLFVTDILKPVSPDNMPQEDSIDVMSSRSVLQSILDFERFSERLFSLMREGGVAYHDIDLSDIRRYLNSGCHAWSFLCEDEDWAAGLPKWVVSNRLRSSEIRQYFERAGFEILRYETRADRLPDGLMGKVKGRFRHMSEEELSILRVFCTLRKPVR